MRKEKITSEAPVSTADNTAKVLRPAILKSIIALLILVSIIVTYILLPEEFKNAQIAQVTGEEMIVLDGEEKVNDTTIRLFKLISSDDLRTIEVTNKNGAEYRLSSADEGGFYYNDSKKIIYTSDDFSALFLATLNTVTSERVYPDLYTGETRDIIPYDSFGLGENCNGRYTVTTKDDVKITVRIGDMAPSGDGYYACVEGRDAVYIMASDVGETVLGSAESIVAPDLGVQGATSDGQLSTAINHVTVWHGGKHIATVNTVPENSESPLNSISNFIMSCNQDISPKDLLGCANLTELEKLIGADAMDYDYIPDDNTYSDIVKALPSLTGEETVAIKDAETGTITDEQLNEFGILKENEEHPAYEIFYSYTDTDGNISYNHIKLSEETDDGYYYAYSNLNSVIAKVPASTLYFLPWGYDRWVENSYFQDYITSFKKITVKSDNVDYTFNITHTVSTEGGGAMLAYNGDERIDSENYRKFYRVLLTRKLRGAYEGEKPAEDTLFLTVTLTDLNDNETVYKYYRASTQQAYLTINGRGEFYCLNSQILKIERDAIKLVNGEEVKPEDWY